MQTPAMGGSRVPNTAVLIPNLDAVGLMPKFDAASMIPKLDAVGLVPKFDAVGLVPKFDAVGLMSKFDAVGLMSKFDAASMIPKLDTAAMIPKLDAIGLLPAFDLDGFFSAFPDAALDSSTTDVLHAADLVELVLVSLVWLAYTIWCAVLLEVASAKPQVAALIGIGLTLAGRPWELADGVIAWVNEERSVD
jgi:hypothetical protein